MITQRPRIKNADLWLRYFPRTYYFVFRRGVDKYSQIAAMFYIHCYVW